MQHKILVVDDCEGVRDVISESLIEYEVLTACNGEEAIALMTDNPADLVILDISMPITDGWETLHILRDEYNGWPDVPVIMLSIHREPENALKSWVGGAQYYLPKPFSMVTLREIVDKEFNKLSTT